MTTSAQSSESARRSSRNVASLVISDSSRPSSFPTTARSRSSIVIVASVHTSCQQLLAVGLKAPHVPTGHWLSSEHLEARPWTDALDHFAHLRGLRRVLAARRLEESSEAL